GEAYPDFAGAWPSVEPLSAELQTFEALLSDGRYADANEWHEITWKHDALPPFIDRLKALREWFEEQERRDSGESDR
ncbi:MAG: hypothetical protein IJ822_07985, partial [Pyramidobacter sp.]|nr:hypothetical protein [Pyramidobacter sp.]